MNWLGIDQAAAAKAKHQAEKENSQLSASIEDLSCQQALLCIRSLRRIHIQAEQLVKVGI